MPLRLPIPDPDEQPDPISAAAYNAFIERASTQAHSNPPHKDVSRLVDSLRDFRLDRDGNVVRSRHEFVWHVVDLPSSPYILLDDSVARQYAEALVSCWRQYPDGRGSPHSRELWILAYFKPSVSQLCLQRLFEDPTIWPIYMPDPRSAGGTVMTILVAALHGSDSVLRSRAAAALAAHFFEITTHWRRVDASLAWIQDQYPDYRELQEQSSLEANRLLEIAMSSEPDTADLAARAICGHGVTFQEQVLQLDTIKHRLRPEAAQRVESLMRIFNNPH